jgi:hypothetical protein
MLELPVVESNADGTWPSDFARTSSGRVEEGLCVLSLSGTISGRTTGSRRRCTSIGCPGWFVGVRWETGQLLFPCSEGWRYDAATQTVQITAGGEISARVLSPEPWGIDPRPRDQWPSRAALTRFRGWRVGHHDPSE